MKIRNPPRLLALIILCGQLAYSGYWMIVELLIRTTPASHAWFSSEMIHFVQTVGMVQQASFYSAALLTVATVVLLLRGNRCYLPVYALAVLLFKVDWVVAGLDGFDLLDLNGSLSLLFEAPCLMILAYLATRSRHRPASTP